MMIAGTVMMLLTRRRTYHRGHKAWWIHPKVTRNNKCPHPPLNEQTSALFIGDIWHQVFFLSKSCETEVEITNNKPAEVDKAAAKPPAATKAITQAGKLAISGVANTMMSLSIFHFVFTSRIFHLAGCVKFAVAVLSFRLIQTGFPSF